MTYNIIKHFRSGSRIKRLISRNFQFGHQGWHRGIGSKDCPVTVHHHHDHFCKWPTKKELRAAGIDPKEFAEKVRR